MSSFTYMVHENKAEVFRLWTVRFLGLWFLLPRGFNWTWSLPWPLERLNLLRAQRRLGKLQDDGAHSVIKMDTDTKEESQKHRVFHAELLPVLCPEKLITFTMVFVTQLVERSLSKAAAFCSSNSLQIILEHLLLILYEKIKKKASKKTCLDKQKQQNNMKITLIWKAAISAWKVLPSRAKINTWKGSVRVYALEAVGIWD